jgi:beta-glucanase (GH16 family)
VRTHSGGGASVGPHPSRLPTSSRTAASPSTSTPSPTASKIASTTVEARLSSSAPSMVVAPPVAAPAPAASSSSASPIGVGGAWHSVFDDEFSSSTLDLTKWSTGWFGSGITGSVDSSELECYDPNQVSETGGELDLNLVARSESCNGTTKSYASGLVTTNGKFNYTYGYLEARAWMPGNAQIADWPAIWTDGQNWPNTGEMDVLEGLSGSACWHFHDPQGGPGGCAGGTYTGCWHTYGADWEPGFVTYYYDGKNAGTISTGITTAPMYVILNLAASNVDPITAPATMRIDYVRVWQH